MAEGIIAGPITILQGRLDRNYDRVHAMYLEYQSGKSLREVGRDYGMTKQGVHELFRLRGFKCRQVGTDFREFNGTRYFRDKRGYWVSGKKTRMHRDVWEFHNGPIPDGWHVHHKDGDPGNNEIDNLDCLSPRKHSKEHSLWRSYVRYEKLCPICGRRFTRTSDESLVGFKKRSFCSRHCRSVYSGRRRQGTCERIEGVPLTRRAG